MSKWYCNAWVLTPRRRVGPPVAHWLLRALTTALLFACSLAPATSLDWTRRSVRRELTAVFLVWVLWKRRVKLGLFFWDFSIRYFCRLFFFCFVVVKVPELLFDLLFLSTIWNARGVWHRREKSFFGHQLLVGIQTGNLMQVLIIGKSEFIYGKKGNTFVDARVGRSVIIYNL